MMKNNDLYLTPIGVEGWADYELIDSGGREKLERFGNHILIRPEPQALWEKLLPVEQWEEMANAIFRKSARSEERGDWAIAGGVAEQWWVEYPLYGNMLRFRLGMTAFKHVGLFPEQAENWKFIYQAVRALAAGSHGTDASVDDLTVAGILSAPVQDPINGADPTLDRNVSGFGEEKGWSRKDGKLTGSPAPGQGTRELRDGDDRQGSYGGTDRPVRVLNLFAYTGGASLAARAAGAEVTHVDSVRQVVDWARVNTERSGLDGIRWIVEDAMKFVRREVRRGKKYDGIILDPPAYGRGADGEKWELDKQLHELLSQCSQLLSGDGFIVMNLYSMGLSALLARTLVRTSFALHVSRREEYGELFFPDRAGKVLPLGVFYRNRIR